MRRRSAVPTDAPSFVLPLTGVISDRQDLCGAAAAGSHKQHTAIQAASSVSRSGERPAAIMDAT